jgi:hypothetical protein
MFITRFRLRSILLAALLLSVPLTIAAQQGSDPKRIEIRAKGPAVALVGEVRKNKDVVYVFSAKAGQRFTGRLTKKDGNIGFAVTDRNGEPLPEEEHEFNTSLKGTLEKTGDYLISVSSFEDRVGKFTLSVRIE